MVVVVAAILAALVFAAIGGVRQRARETLSLANLRSNAQVFAIYSNDFKGEFPWFTRPGAFSTSIQAGGRIFDGLSFFDAHRTWHLALCDQYLGGDFRGGALFPPGSALTGVANWPMFTSYAYPCSLVTDAEYWDPLTRSGGAQFHAVRQDQVRTPSSKALLVQTWFEGARDPATGGRGVPLSTCDGAARSIARSRILPGYDKGDGYDFRDQGAVHFADEPALLHTLGGVRGRDIRE